MRTAAYLAVVIALVLFGYVALFSIGFPFMLTGVLMLALMPLRRRPEIIVAAVLWPWVFTVGYILVAPLGCTTTPTLAHGVGNFEGTTRCNALFFTYAGDASYSPPILPALLVGAALATSAALLVWRAMTRQRTPAAAVNRSRSAHEVRLATKPCRPIEDSWIARGWAAGGATHGGGPAMDNATRLGLDVHKETIAVAILRLWGTKTRIGPVTRSFFKFARLAWPRRSRRGIHTLQLARHLFREHCPATPDAMGPPLPNEP